MKRPDTFTVTLGQHDEAPASAPTRTQEFVDLMSYGDCNLFVWTILERMSRGLKAGETREMGISLKIEAHRGQSDA